MICTGIFRTTPVVQTASGGLHDVKPTMKTALGEGALEAIDITDHHRRDIGIGHRLSPNGNIRGSAATLPRKDRPAPTARYRESARAAAARAADSKTKKENKPPRIPHGRFSVSPNACALLFSSRQ
jgi:hypothetical protein